MELGDIAALKAHSIDVGSVFKMTLYPEDGVKPKNEGDNSRDKYFVVIGKTTDRIVVGSLLINTNINGNLYMRIGQFQHCIYPDQYDFLNGKERYISCYKIIELNFDRLFAEGEYIGQIDSEDIVEAIRLAKESPVNNAYTLKKFNLL